MSLANGTYIHEHDPFSAQQNIGKDVIIPIFYREKAFNQRKSNEVQRAVFDEFDAAKFLIPGDDRTVHIEPVKEEHKQRWPRQWAAYQAGQDQTVGMPISAWYMLQNRPGLMEEMLAVKIRTVEDLARLDDNATTRFAWGQEWRENARKEVKARKSKDQLDAANSGLQETVNKQNDEIAELRKMIEGLQSTSTEIKRGPGRPRASEG